MKVLSKKNIIFLCDTCLDLPQDVWRGSAQEEREVCESSCQTEHTTTKDTEAQTEQDEKEESQPELEIVQEVKRPSGPKKKVMMVKRAPIRIIGDSMVRQVLTQVKCFMPGSGCTSLGGARIHDVTKIVKEEAKDMEDGMLVIQGGGNDLERVGSEETVKEVVEAVKAVEGKNMSVAVVGVLRRPREGLQYERLRRTTNARLCMEVLKIKREWMTEKKGNVSFLDFDGLLKEDRLYASDGVHLNAAGNEKMGGRLREWVRARSLQ